MHAMVAIPRQRVRGTGRERPAVAVPLFDPRIPSSFVGPVSLPATLTMAVISVALRERGSDPTPLVTMSVLPAGLPSGADLVRALSRPGWGGLRSTGSSSTVWASCTGKGTPTRLGSAASSLWRLQRVRLAPVRFGSQQVRS
jgi:hypothetical protein